MSNIKKARSLLSSTQALLDNYDGVLQDDMRDQAIARLLRAVEYIQAPRPIAPQIIAKQTDHKRSCGYVLPIDKTCWYYRVEMEFSKSSHLPDCYFLIDPSTYTPSGARIVGVCKDGFLGEIFVNEKKYIGFAYVNGQLQARVA